MFLITHEGTNFGWTVFYVFLAFAILFGVLGEQEQEITILRSPKEENKIPDIVRDLPILYPQEIQKLLKIQNIFEQKNKLEKSQHKHLWSQAIIPPSPATRNNRETEVCFQCGQIGNMVGAHSVDAIKLE